MAESSSQIPEPVVLVIDDDPSSAEWLREHLAAAGYRPLFASDAESGLQTAMREGPAIVVADWRLPGMNGVALCRAIRGDAAFGTPFVILMTADPTPKLAAEAFAAGVDEFLRKPIDVEEFRARLRCASRMVKLRADLERRRLELHRANVQIQLASDRLEAANRRLRAIAGTDELTGLMNRREVLSRLTEAWALARRYETPLSCIMVDIDHFKRINDTHGHEAGDYVLAETARVLARTARTGETVARLGGEEFLIVCPRASESEAAVAAERFRSSVEGNRLLWGGADVSIRVSLGVAEYGGNGGTAEALLHSADKALYAAKSAGRNRVCHAADLTGNEVSPPGGESGAARVDPGEGLGESPPETTYVLLIDGCADRRAQWSRMLTGRAFDVIEAPSVAEAVDAFTTHRIGAVFLIGGPAGGDAHPTGWRGGDASQTLTPARSRGERESLSVDGDTHAAGPATDVASEWNRLVAERGIGAGVPVMWLPSAGGGASETLTPARSQGEREQASVSGGPSPMDLDGGAIELGQRALAAMGEISQTLAHFGTGSGDDDLSEQARTMALLVDYSRQLIAARDLQEVAQRTVFAAAELTTSLQGALLVPEVVGESVRIVAAVGIGDGPVDDGVRHGDGSALTAVRVEDGAGLRAQHCPESPPCAGGVPPAHATLRVEDGASLLLDDRVRGLLSGRAPVLINTDAELSRYGPMFGASLPTATPAIVAPLYAADRLVGVLHLSRRFDRRPYTAIHQEYVDLLANLAATAIQNHLNRNARDTARDSIVVALASLAETRDGDTGRHLERVKQYCALLAAEMRAGSRAGAEIDEAFLDDIARAVPLHDIGKVATPDRILLKPGRLTPEERAVMMAHTSLGAKAVRSVVERVPGVGFLEMAEDIARSHHERWDGRGYPDGLVGGAIPLAARIASVADVYDALTSSRVYKSAMTHERAVALITAGKGTQFDPAVVDAFARREGDFRRLSVELADNGAPGRPQPDPTAGAYAGAIVTPDA